MKGNIKNKYFNIKRNALALCLTGAITLVPFLQVSLSNNVDMNIYDAIIDHEVSKFMETEEYQSYKAQKEQEYYQMYKNGEISREGFSNKIAELDTIQYAYSIKDQFMSKEEIEDIEEINTNKEKYQKITGIGITASVLCASAAAAGFGIYDTYKQKEEQELVL